MALLHRFRRPASGTPATVAPTPTPTPTPAPMRRPLGQLPPSVARVAGRTRLSAEILAAVLEIEERSRATLDDIERADALADRLIARRQRQQQRQRPHTHATAGGDCGVGGGSPPGTQVRIST